MKHSSVLKAPALAKLVFSLLGIALPALFCCAQEAASTNKPASSKDRMADLFGDPLIAKGKGFEIKRSQLDAEILRTKEALALSQRQAPPDVDRQVLDGMITLKLLLARSTDADKAKAREQFD